MKRKDVQRLAAELVDGIEQMRRDLALRDAQVQQLRQWQAEATTALGDWQAVFDSLVAPRVSPFDLGKPASALTAKEITRLSCHNGELLARIEELEATQ